MLSFDLITNWRWKGELPDNYGWYHILWLIIMVASSIILSLTLAKRHSKKTDDRVIFSIGAMLILIEIYKQVFYTIDAGHYQWYAFPFQFCSVPMYVAFIAPLFKNEKIKEAMYKFLATYGLLAGLAVMLYPDSCLNTPYITILIHTMIWHSSMVVMGVYLIVSRNYGRSFLKELIPSTIIFAVIIFIAILANIICYNVYFKYPELNVTNETFFLLYISPYYGNPFPILGDLKEKVPYVVFLILYLLAFFIGISILWGIIYLIRKLFEKLMTHRKNNVAK